MGRASRREIWSPPKLSERMVLLQDVLMDPATRGLSGVKPSWSPGKARLGCDTAQRLEPGSLNSESEF